MVNTVHKRKTAARRRSVSGGRISVIQQQDSTDCGPACLSMILRFYDCHRTLSECRDACCSGRDGASALGLQRAARGFGLRTEAYSLKAADAGALALPAILHWRSTHFVVLEQWTEDGAVVVDPAVGRRRYSARDFATEFSGVALTMEPTDELQRHRPERLHSWRVYLRTLRDVPGIRSSIARIMLASVALQLLVLVLPALTQVLVDDVIPSRRIGVMPMVALGLAMWTIVQALTTHVRAHLIVRLQERADGALMSSFFAHLLELPFVFFQRKTTGDLVMRLGSNTVIREMLTDYTSSAILDCFLMVTCLAIALLWVPLLGAVLVALVVVHLIIIVSTHSRLHELTERELEARTQSQGFLVEALAGIGSIKASGSERWVFDRWRRLFDAIQARTRDRSRLDVTVNTIMGALRVGSPVMFLWLGAWFVLQERISLGEMLAVNAVAASCIAPLAALTVSGQQLQFARSHLDRVTDVLEAAPEQSPSTGRAVNRLDGSLEFQNVSFRYDQQDPLVLKDVSFIVAPGQKFAVVGRSGSGKSTLVKLLLGLHLPTRGRILWDGEPLEHFDLRSLRRRVGVVLQESHLFSGSIRANIGMYDPSVSSAVVEAAATQADIDDEIRRLPMAYDTLLSEGGAGLSGGQRQRLAIARALAGDPSAIVLDEATSHLDAITEKRVHQNLDRLGRTRIIIAHRLSTVRNADHILVLERGRLVEQGNHDELMTIAGYYASLVKEQMCATK